MPISELPRRRHLVSIRPLLLYISSLHFALIHSTQKSCSARMQYKWVGIPNFTSFRHVTSPSLNWSQFSSSTAPSLEMASEMRVPLHPHACHYQGQHWSACSNLHLSYRTHPTDICRWVASIQNLMSSRRHCCSDSFCFVVYFCLQATNKNWMELQHLTSYNPT